MADFTAYDYSCAPNLSPQEYCAHIAQFLQDNPDAWTRGEYARARNNWPTHPHDPEAKQFCTLGLLLRFVPNEKRSACERLLSRVITPYNHGGAVQVVSYNDSFAKDVNDIIAMFRAASYLPDVPERYPARDRVKEETVGGNGGAGQSCGEVFANGFGVPAWFLLDQQQHQMHPAQLAMLNAKINAQVTAPPNWEKMLLGSLSEAARLAEDMAA